MKRNEELQALTDWEELSREVQEDRRKHKRVTLTFPVEVTGFDINRQLFCERTVTQDISASGCRFLLNRRIARGDVVAIRLLGCERENTQPGRPLLFNVIWVAHQDNAWVAGALMVQREKFWHMEFPDKDNPPESRN